MHRIQINIEWDKLNYFLTNLDLVLSFIKIEFHFIKLHFKLVKISIHQNFNNNIYRVNTQCTKKTNKKLFKEVLVKPKKCGCDQLKIVSGFASYSMLNKHLLKIKKLGHSIKLELIVGMTAMDGISKSEHNQFKKASKNGLHGSKVTCRYVKSGFSPVHAKVYCWFKKKSPELAFVGSSNYTKNGFILSQVEYLTPVIDSEISNIKNFISEIYESTIDCRDKNIEKSVVVYDSSSSKLNSARFQNLKLESTDLSFLDANGKVPDQGRLNWQYDTNGFPKKGRTGNEAYYHVNPDQRGFFSSSLPQFNVLTDDGKRFPLKSVQSGKKGLENPMNNSALGLYFRSRLGVPSGTKVKTSDLLKYGRSDVTFYKVDDDNYLMDFSVDKDEKN